MIWVYVAAFFVACTVWFLLLSILAQVRDADQVVIENGLHDKWMSVVRPILKEATE